MDAVNSVASSIDAVNRVMEMVQTESVKVAEKHMKVAVELKVGLETGKGELLDMIA